MHVQCRCVVCVYVYGMYPPVYMWRLGKNTDSYITIYSLKVGPLTEAGARLTASKPQISESHQRWGKSFLV